MHNIISSQLASSGSLSNKRRASFYVSFFTASLLPFPLFVRLSVRLGPRRELCRMHTPTVHDEVAGGFGCDFDEPGFSIA